MSRVRHTVAALATAGALALSGCGVEERIVHLQPAPTENAETGAPLRAEAAERIAARVLTEVAEAANADERAAVATGPALRVLEARGEGPSADDAAAAVVVPSSPTILAVSPGQDWPRAILAATLDGTTQVQTLHVLVSTGASEPFRLFATAPMLGGTSVPNLGEFTDGAAFDVATEETAIPASQVFADYAAGIAFPDATSVDSVRVDDPYATSLKTNAQQQADVLGDLGTVAQTHAPIADSILTFATADGGFLAFGHMVRTDRVALTDEAEKLEVQDERLRELSGKDSVTDSFTAEYLENVVFVMHAEAPADLIGAEEVLLRAEGS